MAYKGPKATPPGVKPPKARSDKDILEEARDRMKRCIDDYNEERTKQKDDLLFSTLEQWPSNIRAAREGDPNGARPCLTIDQINQYIVQVVNDMRQNKPSIRARPVDDFSDIETAEVFQGIIRQIEDQSTAQVAYATAGESAVRVGEGYFRIITEYESEYSFDQIIRIKRVPDMFCVYLGNHEMPDGSDAEYGFIFEWMPLEVFRRQWPKAKYTATEFSELQTDYAGNWWDNEKICVAEYFYFDYEDVELVFTPQGSMTRKDYDELPEPRPEITDTRQSKIPSVKWCKLTGVEILEKRDWAGKYVPIVKVVGKEAMVNGKKCLWGLVRPAKDSLRMYNYWASTITEKIALSPKTPFIGAKGQFEGLEDRWSQANVLNYPYLEYNAMTVDGSSVPPPQRQPPAPMEVAMIQQLQTIREDVQASLGMFKASLGKEQPNQSGKAILALTRESDTGTYHFADNQSISIAHCGRILIDLIPKIYDTARVVKILGEDGKMRSAEIDPNLPVARSQVADMTGKVKNIYNLGVGTYDVTVSVGPSFNTKRMEAATLFTDLGNTAKDPVSATVMRYLAVKNSDFHGAEQAAEMLEKMLPPGLIQKEGQPKTDPQTQAAMMQMKQIIQAQGQKLQEAESGEKAKEAKIIADHDAKMKQVALNKEVAAEEAKLAREKAEEDARLKRWVAETQAQLDRDIAVAADGVNKEKVQTDKAVAFEKVEIEKEKMKREEDAKVETQYGPQIMEKLSTSFNESIDKFTQVLKENSEMNRQAIELASKPKQVTLKKPDGTTLSANVRTLN